MHDRHGHSAAALLALSLAAAFWLAAPPAHAQDSEAEYQTTIAEAVREFSEGRWEEARALFKQAHVLSPSARTYRGMGMAAYELRLYVKAMEELEASLRDDRKPLTAVQRQQVEELMQQARRFVGRFRFVIEPPEARAIVDGSPAKFEPGNVLFLNVGEHTIGASAPGHRLVSRKLQVEGGEDREIKLILEPQGAGAAAPLAAGGAEAASAETPSPPAPPPATAPPRESDSDLMSTMGYVALIGAGASGLAAAGFWFAGESKFDELQGTCAPDCTDRDIERSGIETADTLTTVFLASAAVWGGLGVVLLVFAEPGGERDAASARIGVGPGGVQVGGRF